MIDRMDGGQRTRKATMMEELRVTTDCESVNNWYETNAAVIEKPRTAERKMLWPDELIVQSVSLIRRVAVGHNALLNVVDQRGGAQGPWTLSVLVDDPLGEVERAGFRRLRFLLVCFCLIDLDQS